MRNWKIQWGDKTIPIMANDVVETLDRAMSIVLKEVRTNPHIRGDTKFKIVYEMDVEILRLIRLHFSDVIEEAKEAVFNDRKGKVDLVGG